MQIHSIRPPTLAAIALSIIALPASGQTLNENFKLSATDGRSDDRFGHSIAFDNGIIAVGSYRDNISGSTNTGSVYLYDASTGSQLLKILASDGQASDLFGQSVAIADGIVAVGANGDDDNGTSSGSAYLFDASTGAELFKLTPEDAQIGDQFGYSIAIDNGIVAVGAWQSSQPAFGTGAVYLFDISTGMQITKLTASDGQESDVFGHSVDISNGIVAVGAFGDDDNGIGAGSAYLFDATTGEELHKLLATPGFPDANFGRSIAIDEGVVVVGAYRDAAQGLITGSAYLFDSSTGNQLFKLEPSDGDNLDSFGTAVAIDNGVVAIGAKDQNNDTGAAYLFDASSGEQLFKLIASDGTIDDEIGSSVVIDNGVTVVGAPFGNGIDNRTGTAYLFENAPDVSQQPLNAVVNEGETAMFNLELADNTGISYQWRRDGTDLIDDGNTTGVNTASLEIIADPHDSGLYDCVYSTNIAAILSDKAILSVRPNPDPCLADITGDGILNFFDVSAFLQAFGAGCP